jgi:hypothetical protein
MNLNKMMKAPSNRVFGMILLFGVVVLAVILTKYNNTKTVTHEKLTMRMNPFDISANTVPQQMNTGAGQSEPSFSMPNNNYLEVSGIQSQTPPSSCNGQSNLNPSDLLPKDMNSEWSDVNPASNDLKNVNLLTANQMIGINTVSSSLRNANYQERSEPVIPKKDVGPWAHSTIEPDLFRRPLEIGGLD